MATIIRDIPDDAQKDRELLAGETIQAVLTEAGNFDPEPIGRLPGAGEIVAFDVTFNGAPFLIFVVEKT